MNKFSPDWEKKTMPVVANKSTPSPLATWPMLRVWQPDDDSVDEFNAEHRTHTPVLGQTRRKGDATGQKELWPTSPIDAEVAIEAARLSERFSSPTMSDQHRCWLRSNLTLRQFYSDWMLPERRIECESGRLSKETVSKDLQAVSRWEKVTRPADWGDRPWPGVPIGMTTGPMIDNFLVRMRQYGYADGTVLSTKSHLTSILHRAERLRLCDPFDVAAPVIERSDNRVLTDEETVWAYRILAGRPELQSSFVLALATGARPSDLFSIKYSDLRLNSSPIVRFTTQKTGTHLVVPLAPVVVAHLNRLPHADGYLFPTLGSPSAKNPERATVSRRRTTVVKSLLFAAGVVDHDETGKAIEIEKPFQVCRSTAATWIERAAGRGISSVLLGHADDSRGAKRVTRVHYLPSEMEPSPELIAAVNAVQWPQEFLEIL